MTHGYIPKQTSFLTFAATKRTRRAEFLDTMDKVIPWSDLIAVIEPHYAVSETGRPKTDLELLVRCLCLAAWYGVSDEQLEDDIHEMPVYRNFLRLECGDARVPDHSVISRFRLLLNRHGLMRAVFDRINLVLAQRGLLLREGTAVDATIVDAPSGTKNKNKERTPGMASGKKGANYRYGMKVHTGTDLDSGIVHSITFTPANVADVSETDHLLHGEEDLVVGDKGDVDGARKEQLAKAGTDYAVCQKSRKGETAEAAAARRKANSLISAVRAIAEYPYRIVKWQWENSRVSFRGLEKNASWLTFCYALANLYIVRRKLLAHAA